MKIALVRASGFVGSAILEEALDRGHSDRRTFASASRSGIDGKT